MTTTKNLSDLLKEVYLREQSKNREAQLQRKYDRLYFPNIAPKSVNKSTNSKNNPNGSGSWMKKAAAQRLRGNRRA